MSNQELTNVTQVTTVEELKALCLEATSAGKRLLESEKHIVKDDTYKAKELGRLISEISICESGRRQVRDLVAFMMDIPSKDIPLGRVRSKIPETGLDFMVMAINNKKSDSIPMLVMAKPDAYGEVSFLSVSGNSKCFHENMALADEETIDKFFQAIVLLGRGEALIKTINRELAKK